MKNFAEPKRILPGTHEPLGAKWDGSGVNFAIYSKNAEMVELCLYSMDEEETAVIELTSKTDNIWHGYIPNLEPGQLYGYRIYGLYSPEKGLRFNPNKLLLDPYSKAISGEIILKDVHFNFIKGKTETGYIADSTDSSPLMPKSIVVDDSFNWDNDSHPNIPWSDTIIYELHVKGFTAQNKEVPEQIRGTYMGLCSPPSLEYIKSLGITAIEIMPIHHSVSERRLTDNGLTNYWGYNTIGFFAPDPCYSSTGKLGEQVVEFKNMVKEFHRENIEVILDVVYNHSAEGDMYGPTLSFRGIDNISYYRLDREDMSKYENLTGTGNTINSSDPCVIKLIIDSLKYWVEEMHVDGFRFDLATALGREEYDFYKHGTLLDIICNDPVLSQVKLIAEPWDIGYGGYQVGNFPDPFSEWNDKYRNTTRRFWRGDPGQAAGMAYCLCGSSNLYELRSKGSHTSINYICSHDGYTLEDLVSYEKKHNQANLENNNDGTTSNFSQNFGQEGETTNKQIIERRERQKRNFLATLLLSQGTPMLLAGDESGRTQKGNNNAYCQDNKISWMDWERNRSHSELSEFTKKLIMLRQNSPVLKKGSFFHGNKIAGTDTRDLVWYLPNGKEFSYDSWENEELRFFGLIMTLDGSKEKNEIPNTVLENSLMLLLNASTEIIEFPIPEYGMFQTWEVMIDTSSNTLDNKQLLFSQGESYILSDKSLALFKPKIINNKSVS